MNRSKTWLVLACLIWFSAGTLARTSDELASQWPDEALGVLIIDSAAQGHLLYLHGFAGQGRYLSRDKRGWICVVEPVPVIAGRMGAGGIGIEHIGPVVMTVYNPNLSRLLKTGHVVQSSDWQMDSGQNALHPDMVISNSVDREMHFIINPRRRWTSWLHGERVPADCEIL